MQNLAKYTLEFNDNRQKWELKNDKTDRVVRSYPSKDDATMRGELKKAVGDRGGSVKIQTKRGRFQEERTYPPSADPHKSKG